MRSPGAEEKASPARKGRGSTVGAFVNRCYDVAPEAPYVELDIGSPPSAGSSNHRPENPLLALSGTPSGNVPQYRPPRNSLLPRRGRVTRCAFFVSRCRVTITRSSRTSQLRRSTRTATRTVDDYEILPLVLRSRRRSRPPIRDLRANPFGCGRRPPWGAGYAEHRDAGMAWIE